MPAQPQNLPGKTDVLIITSATHVAIVMFRTTDETGAGFDNAIAVSKASITGKAPLPAAAPMGGAAPMPMPPAGT